MPSPPDALSNAGRAELVAANGTEAGRGSRCREIEGRLATVKARNDPLSVAHSEAAKVVQMDYELALKLSPVNVANLFRHARLWSAPIS